MHVEPRPFGPFFVSFGFWRKPPIRWHVLSRRILGRCRLSLHFQHTTSCKKTWDFTHVRNAWTYIDLPYVHRLAIVQNCMLWTHWMKSTPWRALLHCFSAKSWRVAAAKQTTPTTLVCALRIWSMEWASSHGQMEGVMMESGCADLRSQIRTADDHMVLLKHTHTHARIFL